MLQSVITDDADGFVENTWVRHTQRSLNKGDEYVVVCPYVRWRPSIAVNVRRIASKS